MTDVLAQVRSAIETRLHEIGEETERLSRALASLEAPRRAGRPRRRARTRRKRVPRGQREEQFVAAIKKKPGAPMTEIAREIKVAPQQLYAVARRLRGRGRIRKQGAGYAAKD